MKDKLKDLEVAVEALVQVAKHFHTPLDTSAVERALNAVRRAAPAESKPEPAAPKTDSK